MSEASWIDVDSRRALPSADQDRVTRYGAAATAATQFHQEMPAILHMIRDAMQGQPGASVYAPAIDGRRHSLDSDEPATHHPDPTGDAGVEHDTAARHAVELRALMETFDRTVSAIAHIRDQYPTAPLPLPDVEPTPGEDWCRSCWKDHRYCEPVSLRPDGVPRFPGLCRWCGEFKQANGFEPPTSLVHRRHRGDRITEGMVTKARADWRRNNPTKGKVKSKRNKGRHAYKGSMGE